MSTANEMQTILVTGAAGFIGSVTSRLLIEAGFRVFGIDNLNDYYDVRLKQHRLENLQKYPNFSFLPLDIENHAALSTLFQENQFDAIINLAARAGVRYSLENPYVYMSTNATGTLNLLDLGKKSGVNRFILASTSSLYAGEKMPFREDLPVNRPLSPYAASKKAAEAMAHSYHHLYGMNIVILRYFTVYGPAGRPDMSPFRFIKWIDEGSDLQIYGDGTQSRDFTYIDDIARGTIAALSVDGFETFNLGGGKEPVSLLTFIQKIEEKLGKKAKLVHSKFHSADMQNTSANIERAKKILHWEPQVDLETGLQNTIDWYLANRSWVKDIQV